MRCEEARESLGLLVLGALEPVEMAPLTEHLADCGECTAERRRLAQIVKVLPYALPEVEPPAILEARLLSRTAPVGQRSARRRVVAGWPAWVPAAAAAVLILGVGVPGFAGLLQRQQAMQAKLDLADQRESLDRAALATLAGGSGRSLGLHATQLGGNAYGVFRMDPETERVVLVTYGLPSAPTGHAYQGWMHRGLERISIGVFATRDPRGAVVVSLSGQSASMLGQVDGFGVTLEPAAGSPQPTTPPVMTS